MIPFDLTSWFRRRMLPLVALSALILQVSAPTAYYLTKRHELWQQAHAEATRTAMLLHGEIEQRPILWRYNVPKLMERLAAEGMLHGRFLDIRTSSGQVVPIDTAALPRRALWGRAEVLIGGEPAATVWVALDMAPLLHGTLQLAIGFAGLALALAVVLYWVPVHTVEVFCSVAIILSYLGWVAAQITALGLVFSVLTDGAMSETAGMIVGTLAVLPGRGGGRSCRGRGRPS